MSRDQGGVTTLRFNTPALLNPSSPVDIIDPDTGEDIFVSWYFHVEYLKLWTLLSL